MSKNKTFPCSYRDHMIIFQVLHEYLGSLWMEVIQRDPYQTLISERVVDAPNEKPERPQVLKPELQHEVSQQN